MQLITSNAFGPVKCYQVFDLSVVKPHEFVQYGLACLEIFANLGDNCAKATREKLKIVVCIFCTIFHATDYCYSSSSNIIVIDVGYSQLGYKSHNVHRWQEVMELLAGSSGALGNSTNRAGFLFRQLELFHLVPEMTCPGVLLGYAFE